MDLQDPVIRSMASEQVKWTTITRTCGELSVSRAIGDRDFKGFTRRRMEAGTRGVPPENPALFLWPQNHSGEFYDDLLVAHPDFHEEEITDEDQFLLLACDGLWDVLSHGDAVKHTLELLDQGLCAQGAAQQLCELATRLGTSDNVTVIIVSLHHHPPSPLMPRRAA
ncbi:phosphatase 2C-like domain-containing protein [Tribonema minus]|uniref:Phosphatase 2C-like domain-containing protein n=1 Tax=Tribonema minus TaxID=303371 RepID=A0A835ZH46_9STRA|nr:phosphatase 2C-like domain-containing protein [Tribonema minus]